MIKKFFKISLVLTMLFSMQQAKADEMKIGSTIYSPIASVGSKTNTFYTVIFADQNSTETSFTSVIMYIPQEIFANGTYDLAFLAPESDSVDDAVKACEDPDGEEEDTEITLPSNDKVYVLGGTTEIEQRGNFIVGKGITIANKSFGGTKVTISGIGSSEGSPNTEEVTFDVDGKLPFSTVKYKVFVSENCQDVVNKSKFAISKKAKKADFILDATANIINLDLI